MRSFATLKYCGVGLLLCCATQVMAVDIVMRPRPDDAKGPRTDFHGIVIEEALRRTVPIWGSYEYAPQVPLLARERMLDEMLREIRHQLAQSQQLRPEQAAESEDQ